LSSHEYALLGPASAYATARSATFDRLRDPIDR